MKKLPIGIQTFSEIIKNKYTYVDKTPVLQKLVKFGKYYFLSRPRRFGKSLFLDTLKEAFSGNKELFTGLYLESNWDWNVVHPIIKIDFGGGVHKSPQILETSIREMFVEILKRESISIESDTLGGIFREMIVTLEKKYNQKVVILIDEYDKPILDNITDTQVAREMRDVLRNLYSVIKVSDAYLKFVFITGVSKFSKVNLFSGLNNLEDITLNKEYATICGYTEAELSEFAEYLVDVNRDELKQWYNGYNFLGEKVYNPFDILLYLKNKEFKNYWFETGSPTFLLELIQKNKYNPITFEHIEMSEEEMGAFDVDYISLEVLLFQTGYLTIREKKFLYDDSYYTLTYPNKEVRKSLNHAILNSLLQANTHNKKTQKLILSFLSTADFSSLKTMFYSFYASIPHDWYRKNELSGYEAYYSAIFYTYFSSLGLDVRPEEVTNHGQADLVVFFENRIFVFELKVTELTAHGSALQQIKDKKYYEKYLSDNSVIQNKTESKEIYLIGVEFSKETRNITNVEWERI